MKIDIKEALADKLNTLATHAEMEPTEYLERLIIKRYVQIYGDL